MGSNLGRETQPGILSCFGACGQSSRQVFTNTDGSERVEPIMVYYFPKRETLFQFPDELMGTCEDHAELCEVVKKGMDPIMQLCVICSYATRNNYTVRAVGTGSSWSRATSTRDILVNMKELNRILTPPPVSRLENTVKQFVDVEVEGGMVVGDFVRALDKIYGLGLPMVGSYMGRTVAGAAVTSSHGSGYFAGTMSTSVVGLHLITYRGIQVRVELGDEPLQDSLRRIKDDGEPCGDPVVVKSTELIQGAVVSIGSLGILYSITYRCVPVYNLEEKRKVVRIPWNGKEGFRLRSRLFNLFSDANQGEFFSIFINPYPQPRRFLYASILQSKRTTANPKCCDPCFCWCGPGGRGCTDCSILQNRCTLSCLYACSRACPTSVPDLINFGLSLYDREEYPFVQKYYNVLGFNHLYVRTAEWCVPLADMDAAVGDVIEAINQHAVRYRRYLLFPIYVRIAKTDHLVLSPANRKFASGEMSHCCYIEVPTLPGSNQQPSDPTEDYLSIIENKLYENYKARPHWTKPNQLTSQRVKELYPDLPKWQEIYKTLNKDGTFCNEFTEQMGFDVCLEEPEDDNCNASCAIVAANAITVQPCV